MKRRTEGRHWVHQPKRGSRFLLRLMLWISIHFGWPMARVLLALIAVYFFLTSARTRTASQDFLRRVFGRPPVMREVFRHIASFASVLLESMFLVAGRAENFEIGIEGLESLTSVLAAGRGCVLLGAHFGSFEVLRTVARHAPVPVRPVMFRRRSDIFTQMLEELDPVRAAQVIELGTPEAMLQVREAAARGEIVGMLADRALAKQKLVEVPFFGELAAFPLGPWIVAASLDVPILLFYGIRTGPRRYIVQFEPLVDRLNIPPTKRTTELQRWVARYAIALETRCRAHPFNWFNFYPFWNAS